MRTNLEHALGIQWKFSSAVLTVLLVGCGGSESKIAEVPRPISWVDVEHMNAAATRTIPAVVRSKDRADLAFQVPGRVARVNVGVGDSVEKDAILSTLDDQTYRFTLDQRNAELAQANAGFVEAELEFARDEDLVQDGAISQTQFESAKAKLDTAKGRVSLLRAAVGIARENLEFTKLVAPYAGEITVRSVEPAQQVQVGQTVLGIQVEAVLEASLTVPEDWINQIKLASVYELTLPALPRLVISARLTEIGYNASVNNAYPLTLELLDPPITVRSGMSAEVTLRESVSNSNSKNVRIPLTAFMSGAGAEHFVFVVNSEKGLVNRRSVEIGEIVDGGIAVVAGLDHGERIAAKGLPYLTDGQRVTLLDVGPQRFLQ